MIIAYDGRRRDVMQRKNGVLYVQSVDRVSERGAGGSAARLGLKIHRSRLSLVDRPLDEQEQRRNFKAGKMLSANATFETIAFN